MNSIALLSKDQCSGCSACETICPQKAIQMRPDSLGFMYPIIDDTKCIDCGICLKQCAFKVTEPNNGKGQYPFLFGARSKDKETLLNSRSGGVFFELAKSTINNNGVVYGVGFVNHFSVKHKRATTYEQISEFRGSKYVESDTSGIFYQVKKDLIEGRQVLFSGTPCQVSGLKKTLADLDQKRLVTVDLVCHGVPAPVVWKDYISFLERKNHSKVTAVNFRDKTKGWFSHIESYQFSNGNKIYTSLYTTLYYRNVILRPSCGKCQFCNLNRPGDISVADFWGWEKTSPKFNLDDKGVSLVFCNTSKGLLFFQGIQDCFNLIYPTPSDAIQGHLLNPTKLDYNKLAAFADDYQAKDIEYILKKYANTPLYIQVRHLLGRIKRNIIRFFSSLR